ncbi:EAL domain-containing protein [Gilvimarinus agarilyticus]|uniref:EAL domain-containing protein n=1 Tax=unclassified Gilvimarinus TaxID=2642066 RepID=UPI001C09F247|nr:MULTISPECIES: EAL domain-containing protein [unclassified Gilvimarinus]MBU2887787.1 EAL domain-containing protein [Gilvimarinus agarilyticus]MDO6572426.1 EAL domain-containing protein [Gilvimarinus sp. 2_MG-2023]MDO6746570.1 EAL domain-containing protein [Gilvimarinus sp. 1_MG-2023]
MNRYSSIPPFASDVGIDAALDQYFPYYQPLIELSTGQVVGHEALARTTNEQGQVISAAPLFFDSSLPEDWVLNVDRAIRRQALHGYAHMPADSFIALNISPVWIDRLANMNVIPTLAMIEEVGLDPKRVVVEVTERSGDLENLKFLTREYQRHGIRVAIDDFGSGASQVDRIIALEPDIIKLDMGLFKEASRGGGAADIALSMTSMAMRAGCQIVCEGVETQDEFDFAVECGADIVQGWIYAPARANPISSNAYVEPTQTLKRQYLERKAATFERSYRHRLSVEQLARQLCGWWRACEDISLLHRNVQLATFQELGILRFYLCNSTGTQVSPNFELSGDSVQSDGAMQGRNWSHRPYFPHLIGIRDLPLEQMVVSGAYRDIRSDDMCKTYAVVLAEDSILMLDVQVHDQVLFTR